MTKQDTVDTHPFARMGPAPYTYEGMLPLPSRGDEKDPKAAKSAAELSAHVLQGGRDECSCCGRPIAYVCIVQCGDGTRWGVGTTCIKNAIADSSISRRVDWGLQRVKADQARGKEKAKLSEAEEWVGSNEEQLRSTPHPKPYWANQGQTLYDYVDWFFQNAGRFGRIRAYRQAKKMLHENKN